MYGTLPTSVVMTILQYTYAFIVTDFETIRLFLHFSEAKCIFHFPVSAQAGQARAGPDPARAGASRREQREQDGASRGASRETWPRDF